MGVTRLEYQSGVTAGETHRWTSNRFPLLRLSHQRACLDSARRHSVHTKIRVASPSQSSGLVTLTQLLHVTTPLRMGRQRLRITMVPSLAHCASLPVKHPKRFRFH